MCIVERFLDGRRLCEFVLCVFVLATVSVPQAAHKLAITEEGGPASHFQRGSPRRHKEHVHRREHSEA